MGRRETTFAPGRRPLPRGTTTVQLLIVIIENEDILGELLTGWLDIGITGATLLDSTDSLHLLSHHVPLFAGFRGLAAGHRQHSKTLVSAIETPLMLQQAIAYLEDLCSRKDSTSRGIYMVAPLTAFGRLGE